MRKVARDWTGGKRPAILIGFSGGGALALLIASVLPNVVGIVTLGGNIDIDSWVAHHQYRSLSTSINPVDVAPAVSARWMLFLVGANDTEVPASYAEEAARKFGTTVRILPDVSHASGWESHWPLILSQHIRLAEADVGLE
jgi:pimeloyl-ACP methyl ester carboxylesterase